MRLRAPKGPGASNLLSCHLRILREVGFVHGERHGRRTEYRLEPGAVEAVATEAVARMGLDAHVEKVDDIGEIVRRGILATSALVVDDDVALAGHVASVPTIRETLTERRG